MRWVMLGFLCLSGCGDDSALAVWCDALCTAQSRCELMFSQDDCVHSCIARNPNARRWSDAAKAAAPCYAALDCTTLYDADLWKAADIACWSAASVSATPTTHVREVCADVSRAWFECDDYWATDKCEHSFAMWSNEVADAAEACLASIDQCTPLRACVNGVFSP